MADRFCRNCGHELRQDDRFCPGCGRPVEQTARVPTPEADVRVPAPPHQPGDPVGTDGGQGQSTVRRIWPYALLAVVVLLVIGSAFGIEEGGKDTAETASAEKETSAKRPSLAISAPSESTTVDIDRGSFTVEGKVTPADAEVSVNGMSSSTGEDGSFSKIVILNPGENDIRITAVNGSERAEYSRVITRGSSSGQAASEQYATEDAEQSEEQEPEQEPTLEEITLSGTGPAATRLFRLEPGLSVFFMAHEGNSNFIVDVLDENGSSVAPMGLANVIGGFSGSTAVQIQRGGQYLLDIQADGPWKIIVLQPRNADPPATRSFSGDSQEVTSLFELSGGLHRVEMTHQGDGNFIVDLLDENGASVVPMGLANEIGPFEGSRAMQVPDDGVYLFAVQANGPWTITVD